MCAGSSSSPARRRTCHSWTRRAARDARRSPFDASAFEHPAAFNHPEGAVVSEVVQMTVGDGVALLTLNRPQRLNAWTDEMEHAYFGLLDRCAASEQVRVIVVTGAGRGFCAGADMQHLQELSDGGSDERHRTQVRRPQTFPLSVPKPIVAAINGACAGIGLVQALMCDIRFAAQGAKLTTAFSRRGLVAEHGISCILPRLVGPARALDLLLSGRVVLAQLAPSAHVRRQLHHELREAFGGATAGWHEAHLGVLERQPRLAVEERRNSKHLCPARRDRGRICDRNGDPAQAPRRAAADAPGPVRSAPAPTPVWS